MDSLSIPAPTKAASPNSTMFDQTAKHWGVRIICILWRLSWINCMPYKEYGEHYHSHMDKFLSTKTNTGFENVVFFHPPWYNCRLHTQCLKIHETLRYYPTGFFKYESMADLHGHDFSRSLTILMDFHTQLNRSTARQFDIGSGNLWMIHMPSKQHHLEITTDYIRKHVMALLDTEIYLIYDDFSDSYKMLEVYRIDKDQDLIVQEVDVLRGQRIWSRQKDLRGLMLRVGYVFDSKFAYIRNVSSKEGSKFQEFKGYDGEKFQLLQRDMNFSVEFISVEKMEWRTKIRPLAS